MQLCLSLFYIPGVLQLIQLNHWPMQTRVEATSHWNSCNYSIFYISRWPGECDCVCVRLTKLITHIQRSQANHRAPSICFLSLRIRNPMHNEKGMVHSGKQHDPPLPTAWGCLSLDVWLLLWIMKHDPHRLPGGHRWIGGKAAHLSQWCRRAFVLYEGMQLFV